MPTPKKGARLGGSPAHQKLILSNLAKQLIEHRAVTTTEAKAKVLRPYMEKLITKAKRGDMHARRTVLKKVPSKDAVYTLFDEIVPFSMSASICARREASTGDSSIVLPSSRDLICASISKTSKGSAIFDVSASRIIATCVLELHCINTVVL